MPWGHFLQAPSYWPSLGLCPLLQLTLRTLAVPTTREGGAVLLTGPDHLLEPSVGPVVEGRAGTCAHTQVSPASRWSGPHSGLHGEGG